MTTTIDTQQATAPGASVQSNDLLVQIRSMTSAFFKTHSTDPKDAGRALLAIEKLVTEALTQEAPQGSIVLAKDHTGMRVDHSGMLRQAGAATLHTGETFHQFMLDELGQHMREMGQRYYAGDTAAVDEFLQLYCVAKDDRARVALAQRAAA